MTDLIRFWTNWYGI